MPLHKNLTGSELHYPLGRASEGALDVEDDQANAYQIKQGSESLLNISTTNSAEAMTLGNSTTNPDLYVPGSGKVGLGTSDPQKKVHIKNGDLVLHNDASGVVTATFARDNTGGSFGTSNKIYQLETAADFSETRLQFGTAGAASDALVIDSSGTMRLAAEVATPSDPGSGNGGFVYVKTDGKLYFRSNSTTETDLTASGSGITAVVDDTSPQLGGNLDCNGNSIDVESSEALNINGGSIKCFSGYGIHDGMGNEQLLFTKTATALNYLNITNAAAGGEATASTSTAPILEAAGDVSETDVDLALLAKGTGSVTIRANTNPGTLSLNNTANTYAVHIKAPETDDLTADYTLTLPQDDGAANQVLKTNGSGVLSWVDQAGGLSYENKTATFTAAVDYFYTVDSSGGDITANLPASSGNAGSTIDICHKVIGNTVTIDGHSSETINGSASLTLSGTAYQNVTLFCTGSEWVIR